MADKRKVNQNLFLKQVFEETELDELKRAIVKDKTIVKALIKLFNHRRRETGRRDDLLDDPNYPIKRAYLDGRDKELGWLLTQLEELTKGDSDRE